MFDAEAAVTPLRPAVSGRASLRVVVAVDAGQVPAWVARMLSRIVAEPATRIVAVLEVGADAVKSGALAGAYFRRDQRRYRRADSPQVPVPMPAGLDSLPHLRPGPGLEDALRVLDVDVLLDAVIHASPSLPAAAARFGHWWHVAGDPPRRLGEFSLVDEVLNGEPCSVTALAMSTEGALAPELISRSVASTMNLSPEANRRYALWKTASFAPRALAQLALHGTLPVGEPCADAEATAVLPSSSQVAAFLPKLARRRLLHALQQRRCAEHWVLAWRYADTPLDPAAPALPDLQILDPPHGHFWADPFACRHRDRDWLFYEELPYAHGIGRIGCVELTPQGPVGEGRTVLELDSHLSYPQVFEWQGSFYMLPENGAAKRARLYRATQFPWHWEPVGDLVRGHGFADATPFRHADGRWYLFANASESGGSLHDELFLFCAESPLGPWRPHPLNPIVSDVRRSRPAGPLFHHQGRLIRPAQNCAKNYGRAVWFNEVTELTPQHYAERPLGSLSAGLRARQHGCHTYCRAGRLEVVDRKFLARRDAIGANPAGESA